MNNLQMIHLELKFFEEEVTFEIESYLLFDVLHVLSAYMLIIYQ